MLEGRQPVAAKEPTISHAPVEKGRLDVEELTRSIMVQVGTMLNAWFKVLQDRLLPEQRL